MSQPTCSTQHFAPMQGVKPSANPGRAPGQKIVRVFWDVDACKPPRWIDAGRVFLSIQETAKSYGGTLGGHIAYFKAPNSTEDRLLEQRLRMCGVDIKYGDVMIPGSGGAIDDSNSIHPLIMTDTFDLSISARLEYIVILIMALDEDRTYWFKKLKPLGHELVLIAPGDVHAGNIRLALGVMKWDTILNGIPPKETATPAESALPVPEPLPTEIFQPLIQCLTAAQGPLSGSELGNRPPFNSAKARRGIFKKAGVKKLGKYCDKAVKANVVFTSYRAKELVYALRKGRK